jgi:hypothetical protein
MTNDYDDGNCGDDNDNDCDYDYDYDFCNDDLAHTVTLRVTEDTSAAH